MKFGKRLKYERVVEWEDKYLNYKELKMLISAVVAQMKVASQRLNQHASRKADRISIHQQQQQHQQQNQLMKSGSLNSSGDGLLKMSSGENTPLLVHINSVVGEESHSVRAMNMTLFKRFGEEISKVNEFYGKKEAEIQGYYARLTEAVTVVVNSEQSQQSPGKLKELKTAFIEFYRGLCMIENYVELNCEGFRKILKKHQKLTGMYSKDEHLSTLHSQHFFKSTTWREMISATEALYVKVYGLKRSEAARNQLLPVRTEDTTASNMFKLGLAVGVCVAFICVIFFLFSHGAVKRDDDIRRFVAVIPVYRAVLIPVLAVWLWGCNVYIWTKKRINYTFIFGLDPRSTLDYRRIFKTAATLSAIWLGSFFLFVATIMVRVVFYNTRYPLILVLFNLALILAPFRALHRRSRFLLFKTIIQVIISPFGDVNFMALYVGDVLTSLVKTIFDVVYTTCYYTTGDWLYDNGAKCLEVNKVALPIVSALPYFWRLLQCLKRYKITRHPSNLGNAGKYPYVN